MARTVARPLSNWPSRFRSSGTEWRYATRTYRTPQVNPWLLPTATSLPLFWVATSTSAGFPTGARGTPHGSNGNQKNTSSWCSRQWWLGKYKRRRSSRRSWRNRGMWRRPEKSGCTRAYRMKPVDCGSKWRMISTVPEEPAESTSGEPALNALDSVGCSTRSNQARTIVWERRPMRPPAAGTSPTSSHVLTSPLAPWNGSGPGAWPRPSAAPSDLCWGAAVFPDSSGLEEFAAMSPTTTDWMAEAGGARTRPSEPATHYAITGSCHKWRWSRGTRDVGDRGLSAGSRRKSSRRNRKPALLTACKAARWLSKCNSPTRSPGRPRCHPWARDPPLWRVTLNRRMYPPRLSGECYRDARPNGPANSGTASSCGRLRRDRGHKVEP